MGNNYGELLKDPRWQKMRLRVLERDNWTCQQCGDNESTLHIHHRVYLSDKKPWECDPKLLVVLCEECHKGEKELIKIECDLLVRTVKSRFFASEILEIAAAFNFMPEMKQRDLETFVGALHWGFKRKEIINYLINKFVARNRKNLLNKRKKKVNG